MSMASISLTTSATVTDSPTDSAVSCLNWRGGSGGSGFGDFSPEPPCDGSLPFPQRSGTRQHAEAGEFLKG